MNNFSELSQVLISPECLEDYMRDMTHHLVNRLHVLTETTDSQILDHQIINFLVISE